MITDVIKVLCILQDVILHQYTVSIRVKRRLTEQYCMDIREAVPP